MATMTRPNSAVRSPGDRADTSPPAVPPQFWETVEMQTVLRSRHMGKVIRAYRHHRYHGYRGLSQDDVAKWAGISQGQVSRLETGPPVMRLDKLIRWSLLLGIPQRHLWFDLPDQAVFRRPNGRAASTYARDVPSVTVAEQLDRLVADVDAAQQDNRDAGELRGCMTDG